jgi:hypothetical protein
VLSWVAGIVATLVVLALIGMAVLAYLLRGLDGDDGDCEGLSGQRAECHYGPAQEAARSAGFQIAMAMDEQMIHSRPHLTAEELARTPSVAELLGPWKGEVRMISMNRKSKEYCLSVSTHDGPTTYTFWVETDEYSLPIPGEPTRPPVPGGVQRTWPLSNAPTTYPCT